MLDERLGKLSFWLVFVGFNVTFFPQHMLGLLGMPRRIYTYEDTGLLQEYNLASTIGSYVMGLGILIFVWNAIASRRAAAPATTRGSPTRSSGTRPRRRRRTTSTRCRT